MRAGYRKLLISILLAASAGRASAQNANASQYAEFRNKLKGIQSLLHIPGIAAAIVSGDSIVWTATLGEADIEHHTPVTSSTRFPIASITKTMSALMLMQLAGENRVALDTPLVVYSPESALPQSVRVAQVLSHTSDLGPGEEYLYNGSRFNTLTAVIERTTGESFGVALRHRVFELADMRRGAVAITAVDRDTANLASPYDFDPASPKSIRRGLNAALGVRAASGVLLSIDDLARYAMALDRGRLLNADRTQEMTAPRRNSSGVFLPYALGWFAQDYQGEPIRWHYGQENSYASLLLWMPRRHLSLVVLANSAAMSDAARLLDGNIGRSLVAQAFFSTVARVGNPQALSRDAWIAEALAETYVGHNDRAVSLAGRAFAAPVHPAQLADLSTAFLLVTLNDPKLLAATRAVTAAVLQQHPTLPPAIYFSSMMMIRGGDTASAVNLLARIAALASPPRQWSVVQGLAELGALQATRDPKNARATLQRVIDMNLNFGGAVDRAKRILATLPPP